MATKGGCSGRIKRAMTPTFVGRKKLYEGYRFYDYNNWLGRTSHALKSGVVRKHAAYDAVWKVPPLPAPLRPTFRTQGTNKCRIPPALVFTEDAIARKFKKDPEILSLFAERTHPTGSSSERGSPNVRVTPMYDSKSSVLQTALRHGPEMLPKLQRRFLAHFKMLHEEKGLDKHTAYELVKTQLVDQYRAFEARNRSEGLIRCRACIRGIEIY
jgi:hypothetical protein